MNRKTSGRKDGTPINECVYSERDGEREREEENIDTQMLNYNTEIKVKGISE